MKKVTEEKEKVSKTTIAGLPHRTLSSSRMRKLMGIIFAAPSPQLHGLTECDGDGEIKFSVDIEAIGLSIEEFKEFRNEIFSAFFVETLGELLVRENLDLFIDNFTGIPPEEYDAYFGRHSHFRFGMRIYRNRLEFAFHISLIRNILTEDFKQVARIP